MSIGEMPICLFFASVEAGIIFVKIGITSSAMTAMCSPTAITWLQPKFSSFVQISFTFIALIPGGRGACFGGERKSLIRPPNPPKFEPQATVSLLFTRPLYLSRGRKNSTKLPAIPEPKLVFVKGASARSRTLTGRSKRNCLRFDQKSSGMIIFFFSSRRRQTRLTCDWSSDVCSSDLVAEGLGRHRVREMEELPGRPGPGP